MELTLTTTQENFYQMRVPDTGDDWWSRSTPVSAICLTIGCLEDEMTCVAIDDFPTIHQFKLSNSCKQPTWADGTL